MLKGMVAGFILGFVVLGAGVYYYFASGTAPVAVADPLMPFERKLAHMALDAHIEKDHVGEPPVPADERNFLAGADVYKDHCATCHGLPGQPATIYVTTMFPKPTPLFSGKGVTDDPPAESYWKAANGIRLSGMPAFRDTLTDLQLWQVSQLVAHANEIPQSVKLDLEKQALAPTAIAPTAVPQGSHLPSN